MRPDFGHVNKESIDRVIGGADLNLKQKKPILSSMKIIEDSVKEQQQREFELELEEEQDFKIFNKNTERAKEILQTMTSISEEERDPNEIVVNIFADTYLSQILPLNQHNDYQSEITRQREGKLTIDNLMKLDYREFIATVLFQCGVISIEKLKSLVKIF